MQNHYNLVYREEEREMYPTLKVHSFPSSGSRSLTDVYNERDIDLLKCRSFAVVHRYVTCLFKALRTAWARMLTHDGAAKVHGQAGALAGVQGGARGRCEDHAAVRALVCGPRWLHMVDRRLTFAAWDVSLNDLMTLQDSTSSSSDDERDAGDD